ncbi:MAG TPA: TolC family protein [Prolixibacteraceae bacterium]|jgi:outer membrane protein TolC
MKKAQLNKWILLVFLVFFLFEGKGQSLQIPVNLEKLVEQSFVKYPKVEEMNDQVRLSEMKVTLGKTGYWPIVNGDISYRRTYPTDPISIPAGEGPAREIQILPANNYNAGFTLVQPLIDFKTSAAINRSRSELTSSVDNLEGFKLQLAYQVAQLYYGIIFLDKSIQVQRQQLALVQSNIQQVQVRIKNGDALVYDLVSMQVRSTNIENYNTELHNQLNKQYNLLNMLTGNSGNAYIADSIISDNWSNQAIDSIFSVAAVNNYEMKSAHDKIETARWGVISNERLGWPTFNLIGGSGYRNGFLPDINQIRFNYSIGAALTIPIFSASRPAIQKKMALINLDASNHALETQGVTLNKDILNALDDLKKNELKLASSDTLIQQATMALKLGNDRYKLGVITTLELLAAQTNYQDALLARLQYEYNLLLTKLEINRLAGKRWW